MHINKGFRGPCLCGADDCPKCFPDHFDRRGKFINSIYKSDNFDNGEDIEDVDDRESGDNE